jgi:UDP-N-acetylglucosamine 2-epimerase (non-hydrolysing)
MARLVGTDSVRLFNTACELLDNPDVCQRMVNQPNPFGDGFASRRIVDSLLVGHGV